MDNATILTKLNELPESLKKEVVDFMEFLVKKNEPTLTKKHPKAGCMKGTFIMKDGFDSPLDDFKESFQSN